jgi:hypothetical protein
MERRPKQSEWLNPRDRQKLLKVVAVRSGWFRVQFAAAPRSIRENYIPFLATGSKLMHDEVEPLEQEHLRKMLAIQADSLSSIPGGIGGISELHQFIESEAGLERQQWQQFVPEGRLPRPWKNAKRDAEKLSSLIVSAESEE